MISHLINTKIFILLLLLVSTISYASANDDGRDTTGAPSEVQDLRYGVILYHFFQQSYFDAITESMVGETRNDMPNHKNAGKLLRGGMSLSYGMGGEAEDIFNELLSTELDQSKRDRAWFYLGKLYYQRGDRSASEAVLRKVEGQMSSALHQELIYMRANLRLAAGDVAVASSLISQLPSSSPWLAYYLFNQGSRQTLAGHWREGVDSFRQLANLGIAGEEARSLADKAFIASGYSHLGAGENKAAIDDFLQVRLESPLVDKALLGYGWAAAQQEDFKTALAPWQKLSKRSIMASSVQESLLAVPFAYEKLGARSSALQQYQHAVTIFEGELTKLNEAIQVYSDMPLVDVIGSQEQLGGDWITGVDYLPINDQAPYLSHLIAEDFFQTAVKDLSDLIKIRDYLSESETRLSAMQGVLDVQQRVWEESLSQSQRSQYRQQYSDILATKNRLIDMKNMAQKEADGLRFLTAEEKELWDIVDHAADIVTQLQAANKQVENEESQLKLFRGLLLWQAAEAESERSWELKKQLEELDQLLVDTEQRLQRLEQLTSNRYEAEFSGRVSDLQAQLRLQQLQTSDGISRAESEIRALAIDELENQHQRLSYYLGQAKLSIARLYDLGSEEGVQ